MDDAFYDPTLPWRLAGAAAVAVACLAVFAAGAVALTVRALRELDGER